MLALSLIRQHVVLMAQRYPAFVSVPSGLADRVTHMRDWLQWRTLKGEPRAALSDIWGALRRPWPEVQKDLACAHLEILFADPVFGPMVFRDSINGFEPYQQDKAGMLRMIGDRGFEGYIGFLVSVMNQQWSQVWMVQTYMVQRGLALDDDEMKTHRESARSVAQLLELIEQSESIRRHFGIRWISLLGREHDLDVVRSTIREALLLAHLSENLTLGASPQSLSRP
jgi:hypothetical protein